MSDSVPADGTPVPQRYWAILTIGMAVSLAVMDGAIANIALPTIARQLHASPADSIWVINAYQLAVTLTLLPLASIGEIYGYRRVYQTGLAVFTLASLACALSDTLVTLALARVLQGLGAAGVMSVNSALTRYVYPRAMLGRGMGINALVAAVSAAIGPTVASGILAVASWEWLFAINVPLGLAAFIIAARSLPGTPRATHRFDVLSAGLNALTLGLFILALDGIAHTHNGLLVITAFAGSALCGWLMVRRQLSLSAPLFPVDLLRIRLFRLSVCTSICSFVGQALAFVALPFFLQGTLGWDVTATGLLMTPWPVMTAITAPIAGRLADQHSAGLLGGVGLGVFAAGLVLLALLEPHATAFDIIWRMGVCGMGFGFFQSPNNRALIGAAPRHRSGGASGMLGTARLLGQTTGAATAALLLGLFPVDGVPIALAVAAAFAGGAALISLARLLSPAAD
jgi:DHA2 family multidrug resistance protein-like MFS transporter